MQLIIGLGNPGPQYAHSRHNIGFMIVDALAERLRMRLQDGGTAGGVLKKLQTLFGRNALAVAATGRYRNRPVTLVKPMTFMNRSGAAVLHYVRHLQLDNEEVLVIFDDVSLPVGSIRLRKKGGAGGHNGVQHVIDQLGASDFPRLRVGIGAEFERGGQVDYVLSPFAEAEHETVKMVIERATDAVLSFVRDGIDIAMNRFNRQD